MGIAFDEFTPDDIEDLEEIVCDHESQGYPFKIAGPKSLARAVERYSDSCDHFCVSTIEHYNRLADKCCKLSKAEFNFIKKAFDIVA